MRAAIPAGWSSTPPAAPVASAEPPRIRPSAACPALAAEPEGLLAARLVDRALAGGGAGTIVVARGEARAARLHRAASALAPEALAVLLLPGWDCLPYDRVPPSRAVMGQRMEVARRATEPGPMLLIGSAEALAQRLPRPDPAARVRLEAGGALDPVALRRELLRRGYALDERVDAPGEAALHGSVFDIVPAGTPGDPAWRLRHEDGRILGIHRFDPLTQRSQEAAEATV